MIQTLACAARLNTVWMVLFLILGFFGRGFLLGTSNLIGSWVDFLIHKESHFFLFQTFYSSEQFIQATVLFVTIGFVMTWVYRIGFSDLCALMVSRIYDEVTYRTSRYPMSFFDTTPVGRILTRFSSDYGNVFRLFGGPLAEFLSIIFDLVWMIGLLTFVNYRYLPFLLLSIFLHTWIYGIFKPSLKNNRRQLSRLKSPGIAHFAESIQGATPIRVFNKELTFTNRFLQLDLEYQEQRVKTVLSVTQFTIILNSLSLLLYMSLALYSWWGISRGTLTIGDIGVAFGLVALSGNTVQMFFEWLAQFEEALVGLERLDEYLKLPLELGAWLPEKASFPTKEHQVNRLKYPLADLKPPQLKANDKLVLDSVWFRYRPDLPWVLKGLSFEIPIRGARLGIIGRTGAGKSTLVQCLFQIYHIEKGCIQIGPYVLPHVKPDAKQNLDWIRDLFSYIPQDPAIFTGSLRDNIDPGHQFSENKIRHTLEKLGYSDWAQNFDFVIEEKGKNLSSGEKQLIQLARVLLQNRPIIVMDEATSNIDPTTEKLVVSALNSELKDRLQIIIAHRLETLLSCSHILWIESGTAKMIGTPDQVLPAFRNQKKNIGKELKS
jgi:ABC-type multidrug transport system fused ATPase/permease subunit